MTLKKLHNLGPLEMSVLGMLGPMPLSVAEVQKELRNKQHSLAYTTVMTVLVRLHAKGWVTREKQGRHFVYAQGRAAGKRRESLLTRVKKALFSGDKLRPILALLGDDSELSQDELLQLRQFVDAKIEEHKGKAQ